MTSVFLGLHTKLLIVFHSMTSLIHFLKSVEGRTLIMRVNSYVELTVICLEHTIYVMSRDYVLNKCCIKNKLERTEYRTLRHSKF